MRCDECKFYKCIIEHAMRGNHGECRRHAPLPQNDSEAQWPAVSADDWCGEHVLIVDEDRD